MGLDILWVEAGTSCFSDLGISSWPLPWSRPATGSKLGQQQFNHLEKDSVNMKAPAGFGEAIRSDLNYASHKHITLKLSLAALQLPWVE